MSPTSVATMDTTPVGLREAAAIEAAEARAWVDLYSAAPAGFAEATGLGFREIGGTLVLHWAAAGRRYFSRTIGLGIAEPATAETLDQILRFYEEAGITMFLLQSLPHCLPAEYEQCLGERGLVAFDAQDRVVRDGSALELGTPAAREREIVVERVGPDTVEEWASFLLGGSRLDAGPFLPKLVGRPGWHQYLAREAGDAVATRSMYIGGDGMAWLGVDELVPGVRTDDYEPDAALCEFIVEDGLRLGARTFLADIEAPSAAMETPAYEYFARLGFRRPYVRTHYARID